MSPVQPDESAVCRPDTRYNRYECRGGYKTFGREGTELKKYALFFLGTDANLKEQNHTEYDYEDDHNDRIHKGLCQPWFSL